MGCYEYDAPPVGVGNYELPITNYNLYNYPNPFNPETKIVFNLPEEGDVKLEIYNIKGQKVKVFTFPNWGLGTSEYSVVWNGTDENNKPVSSGIYFYKLMVDNYSKTKKMLLLK
jgi:hypothetical protein